MHYPINDEMEYREYVSMFKRGKNRIGYRNEIKVAFLYIASGLYTNRDVEEEEEIEPKVKIHQLQTERTNMLDVSQKYQTHPVSFSNNDIDVTVEQWIEDTNADPFSALFDGKSSSSIQKSFFQKFQVYSDYWTRLSFDLIDDAGDSNSEAVFLTSTWYYVTVDYKNGVTYVIRRYFDLEKDNDPLLIYRQHLTQKIDRLIKEYETERKQYFKFVKIDKGFFS